MGGFAPCGMGLGWYLAVNATRLARTKEDLIRRYRLALESALEFVLPENTWTRLIELAIISGARMMLWNKALGYQTGTPRGKDEWEWWLDQLKAVRINQIG
jgi:hypothetical protein